MSGWWDGQEGSASQMEELTVQAYWGGLGDLHVSHQYTGYALSYLAGVCTIQCRMLSGFLSAGTDVTEKLRYAPVVRLNI